MVSGIFYVFPFGGQPRRRADVWPLWTGHTNIRKNRRIHIRRLLLSISSYATNGLLSLSSAVNGSGVNGSGISAVNNCDRIRINGLSLLSLVTTRSERDSCNSYEHKY